MTCSICERTAPLTPCKLCDRMICHQCSVRVGEHTYCGPCLVREQPPFNPQRGHVPQVDQRVVVTDPPADLRHRAQQVGAVQAITWEWEPDENLENKGYWDAITGVVFRDGKVETIPCRSLTPIHQALRVVRRLVCPKEATHLPDTYNDDVYIVNPPIGAGKDGDLIYHEVGVLLQADGTCTNRWADGTVGVPSKLAELVEELAADIDGANCAHCGEIAEWRDVDVPL